MESLPGEIIGALKQMGIGGAVIFAWLWWTTSRKLDASQSKNFEYLEKYMTALNNNTNVLATLSRVIEERRAP